MNMKSNPIIIMKHEQAKKRSGPVDLKRKIGSLPAQLPMEKLHVRGEVKPRSTSKSEEKGAQLGLSKGFLISKRVPNRSTSGERIKSSSSKKGKIETVGKQAFLGLKSRIGRPSPNSSQLSHYHSADREPKSSKQNSKSKSYLIQYLNNRNHTTKAESTGKLQQIRRDQRAKSETERKPLASIRYSSRTRQGVLITNPSKPNQDSVLISSAESEGLHLFAVADGHGMQGHLVSQLTVKRLDEYFHQGWVKEKNHQQGLLTDIYSRIQGELFETKEFNANTSGTTLVSLLLEGNRQLTCANVGDSRAILARQIDKRNWEIIHLSQDHKPSLEREKKRIIKRGGKVHSYRDEHGNSIGPQRVWLPNQNLQGLAMSRSLGDNVSKPIGVTHEPQVVKLQVEQRDKFILLASDGVWEFIRNFQVLQLVVPYYKEGKLDECCDALLKLAYDRWTVEDNSVIDDISFVLIFLQQE